MKSVVRDFLVTQKGVFYKGKKYSKGDVIEGLETPTDRIPAFLVNKATVVEKAPATVVEKAPAKAEDKK